MLNVDQRTLNFEVYSPSPDCPEASGEILLCNAMEQKIERPEASGAGPELPIKKIGCK